MYDKKLILIFLLFLNCGLIPSKPSPESKRSVFYQYCIRSYFYTLPTKTNDQNSKSNLASNNTLSLCLLYAHTFSNDPIDCTSNDIRRFLEKYKILESSGCASHINRE